MVQGPVSCKPWNLFETEKLFLVNWFKDREVYTPETSCMKIT